MTPPRDLADAQARLDRIRDYAQELRNMGSAQIRIGRPYAAIPYDKTAAALERIIGSEPPASLPERPDLEARVERLELGMAYRKADINLLVNESRERRGLERIDFDTLEKDMP